MVILSRAGGEDGPMLVDFPLLMDRVLFGSEDTMIDLKLIKSYIFSAVIGSIVAYVVGSGTVTPLGLLMGVCGACAVHSVFYDEEKTQH